MNKGSGSEWDDRTNEVQVEATKLPVLEGEGRNRWRTAAEVPELGVPDADHSEPMLSGEIDDEQGEATSCGVGHDDRWLGLEESAKERQTQGGARPHGQ